MGLHPDNNNNYSSYRAPSLYSASGAPQLTAPRQQQQLQLLSSSVSLLRIWRTTTHCTKTTTTITALIELRLFTPYLAHHNSLHQDNNNNYSSYRAPSLYSVSGAPQLTAPRQQQQLQLL